MVVLFPSEAPFLGMEQNTTGVESINFSGLLCHGRLSKFVEGQWHGSMDEWDSGRGRTQRTSLFRAGLDKDIAFEPESGQILPGLNILICKFSKLLLLSSIL